MACSAFCRARSSSRSYLRRSVALKTVMRMNQRAAIRIPLLDRVDQHRQGPSTGTDQIEGDLVHKALHPQERCEVRLVEDPAADGQQVLEAPVPDQILPVMPIQVRKVWLTLMIVPSGKRRKVAAGALS